MKPTNQTMKAMTTKDLKLALRRQTLRVLGHEQLAAVAGGGPCPMSIKGPLGG